MNIQQRLTRFLTCLGVATCLAGLLAAPQARASDEDNNVKVDIVVDMTDAGRAIAHPTPDHPAYFYPSVRGYTQGGAVLGNQSDPPPSFEVLHAIAMALAAQGYRVASKTTPPPSLILMFWWGYKAPVFMGASGPPIQGSMTSSTQGGANIQQMALAGQLPTAVMVNHTEMEELVFGANYEHENLRNLASLRLERLNTASRESRYYLMVSAIDFKAATQKNSVVLWTARVSTEIGSQTLEQILPTLIAEGVPMFGRETNGPEWHESPLVPIGHVEVGTPVLKSAATPAHAVVPTPGK